MRQSPAWLIRETIDGTKQRSDLLLSIRHRCRNKSLRKHITYRTKETAMLEPINGLANRYRESFLALLKS